MKNNHPESLCRYGNTSGFTLAELLIVLAIIGILVAIAIPVFLGQREKAKSVALKADARSIAMEVQNYFEGFAQMKPLVFSFYSQASLCLEHAQASANETCAKRYPDMGVGGTYESLDELMAILERHYNVGMSIVSPYNGGPIFSNVPAPGQISLLNSGSGGMSLVAYSDENVVLYSSPVSVR